MHYLIKDYVITVIGFIPFRESESDKKIREIMINVVKRTKEVLGETGVLICLFTSLNKNAFYFIHHDLLTIHNSHNFRGRAL